MDEVTLVVSQAGQRYKVAVHVEGYSHLTGIHCFCDTWDEAIAKARGQQIKDTIRAWPSVGRRAEFKVRYQTNERMLVPNKQ